MDDRLKQLQEYTRFHIGMYTTLCTLLVGVVGTNALANFKSYYPWLLATLVAFVLAGAFGGLVGSSTCEFESWDRFAKAKLGPWGAEWIPSLVCAHIEHTMFWIGILLAVVGLFVVK